MTEITASMVRDLRERTGVAMMECKKALIKANGEMELAIETLRKEGQVKAVKKGGRIAAEGLIAAVCNSENTIAEIVEVNCETDFVSREDRFKNFTTEVAKCALQNNIASIDKLAEQNITAEQNVEAARLELVAQIGENIALRRVKRLAAPTNGSLAIYLHGGDGSTARIASVVVLDVDNVSLARDIAMHIAAMRPEFLRGEDVPAERVNKEKEILMAQAKELNPNKPDEIIEKIVTNKMRNFIKEISLLDQSFVKNPDQTITTLLASNKANIVEFIRYEVGEGIEKKESDFVSEVMAQVKG